MGLVYVMSWVEVTQVSDTMEFATYSNCLLPGLSVPAGICSESAMEAPKHLRNIKFNNKDTRATSMALLRCLYC